MEQQIKKQVVEFVQNVERDDSLQAELKKDPVKALRQGLVDRFPEPLIHDFWIYRIVVSALGLSVVIAVVGAIILASAGQTIPEILLALGSAAVGALAGLLAPKPGAGT